MKKLFTLVLLGFLFNACQSDQIPELQKKLVELDKAMGGASVTDKTKAAEFIKTSETLAALLEIEKNAKQPIASLELSFCSTRGMLTKGNVL